MTKKINIIFILLTSMLFSCLPHRKTAQEYFDLGQHYENDLGQLKNALRAYSKAIKKDNKQPYYYVKKAEMLYLAPIIYNDKKTTPKVYATYGKAMNLIPWYDKALLSCATFLYRHDNLPLAKEQLDSLISKYPENIDGHLLLAKIYFDKKDESTAKINLNKALEKSKNSTEYLNNIGDIYQEYNLHRQAINCYRTSLEKTDKVKFDRYYSLGMCYYKLNILDSACYFFSLRNSKTCFGQDCKDLEIKCK